MANPITQAQLDAMKGIKVVGEVSSADMAALGEQLYFIREWIAFLDTIDWTQVPAKGGPTTATPPKPPAWPP
jgi:hypothetical protein